MKIEISADGFSLNYEGNEKFFLDHYKELLKEIGTYTNGTGESSGSDFKPAEPNPKIDPDEAEAPNLENTSDFSGISIDAIVKKLDMSKGKELFKAASASLSLVQSRTRFTRKEILEEAKKSSAWKDSSHKKNSSNYIKRLMSDDFFRSQGDQLYLSPDAEANLRGQLAT